MKKISEKEIQRLKDSGVNIKTENGNIVVPKQKRVVKDETTIALNTLAKASTEAVKQAKEIVSMNTAMVVKLLEELKKPRPKRKTSYRVIGKQGHIKEVIATEL